MCISTSDNDDDPWSYLLEYEWFQSIILRHLKLKKAWHAKLKKHFIGSKAGGPWATLRPASH